MLNHLCLRLNFALPDASDEHYTWQCVKSGRDVAAFLFLDKHCPLRLLRTAADFLSSTARSMFSAEAISAFVTDTKRQSLARLAKPPAIRAWGTKPEEYVKIISADEDGSSWRFDLTSWMRNSAALTGPCCLDALMPDGKCSPHLLQERDQLYHYRHYNRPHRKHTHGFFTLVSVWFCLV